MDHDDAVARVKQTLQIDRVAVEVIATLSSAGVESILLKGASFAGLLYPQGGRVYGDVDLLVSRPDLPRAAAVLNAMGYFDGQEGFAAIERHREASTFVPTAASTRSSVTVDLHANLHWLPDADRTWRVLRSETEEMTLGRGPVQILNVAARAMHVALHASHHGLDGPQPHGQGGQTGEDLRRAVRVIGRTDWAHAGEIASRIGASEAFTAGVCMDPAGVALAESLGWPFVDVNGLWQQRAPFHLQHARGALTFHRLTEARSRREKLAVVARWAVPSRARARAVADSAFGRRSLFGAYVEYWFDALYAVPRALRSSRRLPRG
ncbi:MAG: hypothetical protein QOF21_5 [Actinomycetota bacterium]